MIRSDFIFFQPSSSDISSIVRVSFFLENEKRFKSWQSSSVRYSLKNDSSCEVSLAKKHKGVCLSKMYKDSKTPMNWKCENGHHYRKPAIDLMRRGIVCLQCKKDSNLKLIQDKAKAENP